MDIHSISGSKPILPGAPKPKEKKKGAFDAALSSPSAKAPTYVDTIHKLDAPDALLSLQEVSVHIPKSQEMAKRYATSLLDHLDQIRFALLEGSLSLETLQGLKDLANQQMTAPDLSPQLRGLLEDIKVRAAVEIAKLERIEPF